MDAKAIKCKECKYFKLDEHMPTDLMFGACLRLVGDQRTLGIYQCCKLFECKE